MMRPFSSAAMQTRQKLRKILAMTTRINMIHINAVSNPELS